MVGRNACFDQIRKSVAGRQDLPDETQISDLEDVQTPMAERLDDSHYRDDVLRLMFICCHPDLPATRRIPLALRAVDVGVVGETGSRGRFSSVNRAMEQRITRAKAKVADAGVPFDAGPGRVGRSVWPS